MTNKATTKNTNLSWNGVEYDYERSACTCNEWICRCTTIDRAWIESININKVISNLYSSNFNKNSISYIDFYCFDRICRFFHVWDKEYYEVEVCGGYYGEEIGGVYFENEDKVISEFNKLLELKNDIDKIKYILQLEYGYVIESVENSNNISIINCNPKLIIFPQREYYRKLEKNVVDSYKGYKAPCAICKKQGDKYLIVDGYHRVAANQDEENITIIVIE